MVYGVDVLHGVRETEGVGLRTDFGDDVEWSKELLGELSGWMSSAEEFSLDESLVTNLEVWWQVRRESAGP